MTQCWQENPEERPTFNAISSQLEELLYGTVSYTEVGIPSVHNKTYCSYAILSHDEKENHLESAQEEKLKLLSENTDGISEDNCKNLKDTNSRMNLKPQHTVSSPWHSVDKTSEQVSIPKHRSANPPNNLFIPKSTSGASGAFPDKYGSLDRLLKVSDYIQKSPDKRRHSLNSPSAIAANTTNTEQKALLEYEIPNNKLNTYITH